MFEFLTWPTTNSEEFDSPPMLNVPEPDCFNTISPIANIWNCMTDILASIVRAEACERMKYFTLSA